MNPTIIVRLIQLILTSRLTASDIAAIIKASVAAVQDIQAGKYVDALQAIAAEAPDALPLIEAAASLLFPGAGAAIDVLVHVTGSAKMTHAEEQAWFDRQNPNVSGA